MAIKCLDVLMEGMVDYGRLEDFGDVVNLYRLREI